VGWYANTLAHVPGVRAFGTRLLFTQPSRAPQSQAMRWQVNRVEHEAGVHWLRVEATPETPR
jgi:hypothetical protein